MGQKVHPEAMRVGYIHDWKSNWFSEKQFSDFLIEDVRIRDHITNKLAHAGLSDITIRKDAAEVEVNIHTARPGIVIGKSGSEVDALRRDLKRITGKSIKVNILRSSAPSSTRSSSRSRRRAAPESRRLPSCDEARAHQRDALGRQGCKIQVGGRLGGAEMSRTERLGPARPAPHAAPRHRLRLLRGPDDVRPHRRQVLDQQGRDHARRLHRPGPHVAGRARRRPAGARRRPPRRSRP